MSSRVIHTAQCRWEKSGSPKWKGFPLVLMYSLLFPSMDDQGSGKWDCGRLYALNDHVSNLKCMGFLGIAWMIERVASVVRSWCSEPQWDPHTRTDCVQSLPKGWRCFGQLTCTRPSSTRCAWQVGGTKASHVLMSLGIFLSHWYLQRGLLRRPMFYLCVFFWLFRWYIAYNVLDIKWGFFLLPTR